MIKKYILLAMLQVTHLLMSTQQQDSSLSGVLDSYQQALKQLIIAHAQLYPKQPLSVNNDRLIMQTYQKLITPSAIWIRGYAQLVSSELTRDFDVSADLNHLYRVYIKHEQEAKKTVQLFEQAVQKDFMNVFYDAVAVQVVQVCFDIVQKESFGYQFDQKTLRMVYQAYQLAWRAQTVDMHILGCKSQADFQQKISQNMQTLFSSAMNNYQAQLQQGMVDAQTLQPTYKILQWCAQVLSDVYSNNGDTQSAATQKSLMQNFASQEQAYQKAITEKKQADKKMQQARALITLDVNQASALLPRITASLKACATAQTLYENAIQNFTTSSDSIDASSVSVQLALLNGYDIFFRFIQKLWTLFLIDQSAQGVLSFPTLAAFVQGNAAGQVNNAVQVLNNLSAMISNQYVSENNMIGLTGATQDLLLSTILDDMQNIAQKNCTHHDVIQQDALFDMRLLLHAQQVATALVEWCNALTQAVANTDQNMAQDAMGYAQVLDTAFQSNVHLTQLIPHLPDCLSSNKTWVNFTAQFLVQAGLVTQAAQAVALVSKADIQIPAALTEQDIQTLRKKTVALWSQAEAFTQAQNFASAATAYQTIMTNYQTLYANASDANAMIEYSQKANIAQTRFAAFSLAGTVQPVGLTTFATIKNIPASFLAQSYSLSIDPSILNNSIPQFLSALPQGKALKQLTILQKQELLALLKAYLIAQNLDDQGLSFTTYYSDYQLTVVQQSKRAGLAEEKISHYLASSVKIDIASVTVGSDGTITMILSGFPLSLVTPVCSTVSSAVNFYQSAALLLQPSAQSMVFGGQSYVSGNDAATAKILYQKAAYVYLAQAAAYINQAHVIMQQTLAVIGKKNVLPQNFSHLLSSVSGLLSRARSLMNDPDQSAYANLIQAGLNDQADLVQQQFLNLYEKQITFGQKCLVGDPTKSDYQNLVSAINQWYVTLGTHDPNQITVINQNIAQLYENAGQSVLKFKYVQSNFANFEQIHYMLAASYLRSAQQQYQLLNNSAQVQALENQINGLFFQATIQNLNLYQHVKQYGVQYTSTQNQAVTVSFDQLQIDFNNAQQNGAAIDPNEMRACNQVQKLLLDAALVLSHLQNVTTVDTASVLKYLQKQKIITNQISDFAQIPLSQSNQIFTIAAALYQQFATNSAALAACAQLLFNAVKDQYMQDYLGATTTSTAEQLANCTQEFLASVQQETMSLTNPSIGYVQ